MFITQQKSTVSAVGADFSALMRYINSRFTLLYFTLLYFTVMSETCQFPFHRQNYPVCK